MNPFDLTGKVDLITGGTRGLGRAIALEMASAGWRLLSKRDRSALLLRRASMIVSWPEVLLEAT